MGKVRYKVRNWPEYNQALKNRYRLELWLSDDVIDAWYAEPTGRRGSQPVYSDTAIMFCLTIRALFHLPLRGCEGFAASILKPFSLPAPDYTTLCRRARELEVRLPVSVGNGSVHIVVDSTGMKIYGEGEWKVRMHGISKRRTWRKLHIGVDESSGEILVAAVTTAGVGDGQMLPCMLEEVEVPIRKVGGDGAYDTKDNYRAVSKMGAEALFMPREDARLWGGDGGLPHERDRHVKRIGEIGRSAWRLESGYSRRSLAETAVSRLKGIFGDRLKSRDFDNQAVEAFLMTRALNIMTGMGMPNSYPVN